PFTNRRCWLSAHGMKFSSFPADFGTEGHRDARALVPGAKPGSPRFILTATRLSSSVEPAPQRLFSATAARAAKGSTHRLPAPSLRIPVTAANRSCLRALRAAELAAWQPLIQARNRAVADEDLASLRRKIAEVRKQGRIESRVFAAVALIAGVAAIFC